MFLKPGWKEKKIGAVAKMIRGGAKPRAKQQPSHSMEVPPFLREV